MSSCLVTEYQISFMEILFSHELKIITDHLLIQYLDARTLLKTKRNKAECQYCLYLKDYLHFRLRKPPNSDILY